MKQSATVKTIRPALRQIYFRQRIIDELRIKLSYPVVWIDGDAGSGKTTLVNSFIEKEKFNHLWYRIGKSDNNIIDFLSNFTTALDDYLPKAFNSLKILSLPFQPETKTLHQTIFNELEQNISSPFYLILDDFHLITNNNFHEMLVETLIDLTNIKLTLIIISRHVPPPAYARLRARQLFSRLDKKYLQWNEAEVVSLTNLLLNKPSNDSLGRSYFKITQGWVAGIILLNEKMNDNSSSNCGHDEKHLDKAILFDYFASEIFSSMTDETQLLLMKASFLTEINVKRDKAIFNNKKFKSFLEGLCDRNYFTNSGETDSDVYTFHPLFKDFLQKKAYSYLTKDRIFELQSDIAHMLFKTGRQEPAIELYLQTQNWKAAAHAIEIQADKLFSQGKAHRLLAWIKRIDKDQYVKYVWLQYWEATANLAVDHNKAYCQFKNVYDVFLSQKNVDSQFRAICGVFESILFSHNYYERLTTWIKLVTKKYAQGEKPSNIELRARLAADMHTAILFSEPTHKDMDKWSKKVRYLMKILKITFNNDHRVLLGVNLFYQYLWLGDKSKAENILKSTMIKHSDSLNNPVSQGAWYVMASLNAWMFGDANEAKKLADYGIKVANESGIYFWKNLLIIQKSYACLINLELDEVDELLVSLAKHRDLHSQVVSSLYYDVAGQLAYFRGDLDDALENEQLCMDEINKMCMPFAITGLRLGLAEIHIARKEYTQAMEVLRKTRKEAEILHCDIYLYRCHLLNVRLALELDNKISARKIMSIALELAEKRGFESHPWWNAKNISNLYKFALDENINTEYVIHCIKKKKLSLNINFREYENWSWEIKIHTLGDFKIVIKHTNLLLSGKSQRKPLALLKAIISFGAWRVNQTLLAEKLWPDVDGSEASQSMNTTIHRLRRIIGPKAILVKDGYIGLNSELVWLDVDLLKQITTKISKFMHRKYDPIYQTRYIDKLLNLYKGKFYENDHEESWCFHYSQLMHKKTMSSLSQYVRFLRDLDKLEDALGLLFKMGQIDILDESIYQNKIEILVALNRQSEALSTYNDCRTVLSRVLGTMPSIALPATFHQRKAIGEAIPIAIEI